MNTQSAESSVQLFGKIWPQCIARAWQDVEFREALKRDPMGTLRDAYQLNLPVNVKLEVVEGNEQVQAAQADTLRMVIPPAPAMDMRQVALTDLETGMVDAKPFTHHSFTS